MTKISTIIVTYNAEALIEMCINSIRQSTIQSDIIVVDNCSADKTVNIIKEKFGDVHLISCNKNLGFGAANNIGIKHALKESSDYFLLLNQDAFLTPETLEALVEVGENNNEFGIISPVHLNAENTAFDPSFVNYYISNFNCPDFISDVYLGRLKKIYACKFVNAAAWLVSKKCIDTIGGFNPSFFMYGEDNDYCNRALYHGFKIGICRNARITHLRSHPSNKTSVSERRKKMQRLFFIGYKIALTNPAQNFLKSLLQFSVNASKLILKSIVTFNFIDAFLYFECTFSIFAQLNQLFATKKQSKLIQRSFLLDQ